MRFASIVLTICILICAPLIGGCSEKKEGPVAEPVKNESKKQNPRGLEHPPVPEPPP